jgi:hypothetical protein
MNAPRPADGLAKQSLQLRRVQAVPANDSTIQEQYRDIEPVTALQNGVAVNVDDFDGRERSRACQCVQLAQHLIAQLTVVAMVDYQMRLIRHCAS